jgi:hypothetical protein
VLCVRIRTDVVTHFNTLGLSSAAEACNTGRVSGAVLLTLYRKDCFLLGTSNFGDTIEMWKEINKLQTTAFGRSLTPKEIALASHPVSHWTIADVCKFLEVNSLFFDFIFWEFLFLYEFVRVIWVIFGSCLCLCLSWCQSREMSDLAEVCRREKISGSVMIAIEKNEDLAGVSCFPSLLYLVSVV